MQSICDQLLFEESKGYRNLKKIKFIWMDRDPVLMEGVPLVRCAAAQHDDHNAAETLPSAPSTTGESTEGLHHSINDDACLFSQLFAILAPGHAVDEELDELYESLDAAMDYEDELMSLDGGKIPEDKANEKESPTEDMETSTATDAWPIHEQQNSKMDDILDLQLFAAKSNVTDNECEATLPNVKIGQPNLKELFLEMRAEAIAKNEKKVAVCICAPHKVAQLCQKACVIYSDSQMRFDFHSSGMEM